MEKKMTEIVRVKCPHRIGLCYRDGDLLRLLPCDCNEPSEVLEIVADLSAEAERDRRELILADRLATVLAERDTARREAGERIAVAIEAKIAHIHRNSYDSDVCDDGCGWLAFAARIARADALASDDGSGA